MQLEEMEQRIELVAERLGTTLPKGELVGIASVVYILARKASEPGPAALR